MGHENEAFAYFAEDGRTIMLAFDHGYIMGSTAGLERLDLAIPPLMEYADCLMATRGALRACIPPDCRKAIALRCTADTSVLKDDMSHGVIGVGIEDAIRMNASCMAVQCFVGADGELGSLENLVRTVDAGERYGIPVLGVVAVGKEMERTTRYFALATRLLAELGAHMIKTYYCENFEQITAACPVPIVIAGGKKYPNLTLLKWRTVPSAKALPVWIWAVTCCRPKTLWQCLKPSAWLSTKMPNRKKPIKLTS